MNSKWLLLATSSICGLIGGVIGHWIMLPSQNTATFETIRVTKDLFVSSDAATRKGCRISADGTITATGGFVANQIRGNLIVGRSILASTNATEETLDKQKIAVEISANEDRGGELILRNRDGILCPAQGPATKGFATFLGFNKANHAPAIYTQDISQGTQGMAFVVCAKPKPASTSLLKKETGFEPTDVNAIQDSSGEVPAPVFQRAAKPDGETASQANQTTPKRRPQR